MLRYLTAGETHGKCITAIIEGFPSNLKVNIDQINIQLKLRQKGYGRGDRMKIENDKVEILSGVRGGYTLGSPICFKIKNNDWENQKEVMNITEPYTYNIITKPRPGHSDLSGVIKYNQTDIRNVLERASARETTARVAVGSMAEQLLKEFGISMYSHVIKIGNITSKTDFDIDIVNKSLLHCADSEAEKQMINIIEHVKQNGDSLGGVFEIIVTGVPIGLGSFMHWDRKLDARLAYGLMSIQGIKGVEFGMGFESAGKFGSQVHDEIFYNKESGYYRKTNNAGGIEGGMSNGENIIIRAVMKPIPTLLKPLESVDIITKRSCKANVERSDVCAVSSASVVGHAVTAWEIGCALVEKFGGDSIEEMKSNYERYIKYIKNNAY